MTVLTFQTWYDMDLDSLNQIHDIWDVQNQGSIPTAYLQLYPVAIWHTSNTHVPLSAGEQNYYHELPEHRRTPVLDGENIDEQLGAQPFYANTLHATSLATAGSYHLHRCAGDSISTALDLLSRFWKTRRQQQLLAQLHQPGHRRPDIYTYNSNSRVEGIRWQSGQ